MSWETTLFYWTGWFATTSILAGLGVIGSWGLWQIYNSKESAFYANAALLRAYIEYAYKYRFRDIEPSKLERFQVDGYEITVEKISEDVREKQGESDV